MWTIKKLSGIVVLCVLWCDVVLSEVTNGDLTTSWQYKSSSEQIVIEAYNANATQSLTITKIQIWYGACSAGVTDKYQPNKIYDINQVVQPRSDKRIYKSSIINHTGQMCSRISHKMNGTASNKSTTTTYKKPKKTEENPALVILFVLAVIGFFVYKFNKSKNPEGGFSSGSRSSSTKKISIPDTPKIKSNPKKSSTKKIERNSVDVISIKEFNDKIKSYIPSHQISQLPAIGDVEGQEFECGCGNSHIMNFDQHYFIADGGFYKAVFLSPQCNYLNALKLKGPMTNGIKNLCSTKYLSDKKNYGFADYPDFAGAIDKFFIR